MCVALFHSSLTCHLHFTPTDVNTTSEDLKASVVKQLKAGQPVWFGCDVGQFSDSALGIMDTALHTSTLSNAFSISFGLSKAERLQTNESAMTHAMVITAAHVDPATGKPTRFKVENSWGEDRGEKGWFMMTDKWFDEFVYQVVVPKKLAPAELVKIYEKGDPVVLEPWDPMVRWWFSQPEVAVTESFDLGCSCVGCWLDEVDPVKQSSIGHLYDTEHRHVERHSALYEYTDMGTMTKGKPRKLS